MVVNRQGSMFGNLESGQHRTRFKCTELSFELRAWPTQDKTRQDTTRQGPSDKDKKTVTVEMGAGMMELEMGKRSS